MSIICGYADANKFWKCEEDCDGCNSDKIRSCNRYNPRFTEESYNQRLIENIQEIKKNYTKNQIRSKRGYGSLRYAIGIFGHCAEFPDDYDSIYYIAGVIVILQNHRFKLCDDFEKVKAYEKMKEVHLKLSKSMYKDYIKAKKRINLCQ